MPRKTTSELKATLTRRALLLRVNRKLQEEGAQVRKTRPRGSGPATYDPNLGEFFRIDLKTETIAATHIDLEGLGRKLGVLRAWEKLESEE